MEVSEAQIAFLISVKLDESLLHCHSALDLALNLAEALSLFDFIFQFTFQLLAGFNYVVGQTLGCLRYFDLELGCFTGLLVLFLLLLFVFKDIIISVG